jgi:fimbrial isopeptide formation D2 family protein/LPXTG-motif cell wall-anchored protein
MKAKEERPRTFLRRIGAALVAMCIMSLSFVTGVMADTSSYAKTVTFSGMKAGDSVTAYRLVSYTTSYNDYVFADKFGSYIDQFYTGDTKTTALRTAYFKDLTNAQAGTLVSDFAAAAQASGSEYGPISEITNSTATAKATAEGETAATATLTLEPGYYMVLGGTTSTNSVLYSPTCVFVKPEGSNVKVYAGASSENITETLNVAMKTENAPELDKMSRNPDHKTDDAGTIPEDWSKSISSEVGDTVDFRIKVTIPKFNDGTKLNLTVKDTMTNLEYETGTVKVYADENLTNEISGGVSNITTEEYGATTAHQQNISIKLDFDKVHSDPDAQSIIYVYYKAKVKEDSSVDNVDAENVAKLQYSNTATPDSTFDTPDSKTDVDLYEIKLHKTDESGSPLAGAKFKLYENTTEMPIIKFSSREKTREVTSQAEDGSTVTETVKETEYYPDDNGTIEEVPCDGDGVLHIVGLDVGEYILVESTVPTGYYAPSNGFMLSLKRPTNDGKNKLTAESSFTALSSADSGLIMTDLTKITSVEDTEGKVINNIYEIYLKNSVTPKLPTAGGMGTIIFTIVGIAMMTAACVVIFARKKDTNVR